LLSWLRHIMGMGLDFFYQLTNSYGLAIILLSVAFRLAMLPVTIGQTRSLQKVQELQPQLQALQKKYKNDPQRLNRETAELYRQHKINPLSGCLLFLVQLPFLIAFFQLLQGYSYQGAASFLWIPHLGEPDRFVLPILAGLTTFWHSRVTTPPTDGSQKIMQVMMPVMIAWISMRFAAGVALYWVTGNLVGIAQQYLMPGSSRRARGRESRESRDQKRANR